MTPGDLARRLQNAARGTDDLGAAIVEHLAETAVDRMQSQMGRDTGQLSARTGITHIAATGVRAEAVIDSDTPYAGHHNYGTRHQPPNGYFSDGMRDAEREARRLGGTVGAAAKRILESGGSANPRSLFK